MVLDRFASSVSIWEGLLNRNKDCVTKKWDDYLVFEWLCYKKYLIILNILLINLSAIKVSGKQLLVLI